VRSAPGGVGIGSFPGDTATVGDVLVSDTSAASAVFIGDGVTLTSFEQAGGQNRLAAAATVTTVTGRGGTLAIAGEGYTITTLTIEGATVTDTHLNAGGAEWGTINLRGGTLDVPHVADAGSARTCTTLNHSRGRLEGDLSKFSATTWSIAAATGHSAQMAVDVVDA
jgi:hypothetical protein